MPETPVTEFEWPAPQNIGPLFTMTCKNHRDLRWSTKHPMYRSLHYLGLADHVEVSKENAHWVFKECDCKYEDLLVIGKED